MPNPRVTVILTSYNHARFVGDAIQSVLDQTYEDFELLVVDDCSGDDSVSVIQQFRDPRLHLHVNPQRLRGANGINACIDQRSRGELIAIHHSDDLWLPDKLARQVAFLDEHPEVGAVFSHAEIIDEEGEPWAPGETQLSERFAQPNRDRLEWLGYFFRHGNALCHPSALIRRSVYEEVGGYDYGFGQLGDLNQWVRTCLRFQIHVLQDPLVRFRLFRRGTNTSADRLEVHIRSGVESLRIYRHYTKLSSSDEVATVFSEPRIEPAIADPDLVKFLVGRAFLQQGYSTAQRLFGLEALHEVLQAATIHDTLKERFDFDAQRLVEWSGTYDVLGTFNERYLRHPSRIVTELFLDRGQGYSAEDCVSQPFQGREAVHEYRWDPPVTLTELRFDPINVPSVVELRGMEADLDGGEQLRLTHHNGIPHGNRRYLFGTRDSRFYLGVNKAKRPFRLRALTVRLAFPALLHEGMQEIASTLEEDRRHYKHQSRRMQAELASLSARLAQTRQRLETVTRERDDLRWQVKHRLKMLITRSPALAKLLLRSPGTRR